MLEILEAVTDFMNFKKTKDMSLQTVIIMVISNQVIALFRKYTFSKKYYSNVHMNPQNIKEKDMIYISNH